METFLVHKGPSDSGEADGQGGEVFERRHEARTDGVAGDLPGHHEHPKFAVCGSHVHYSLALAASAAAAIDKMGTYGSFAIVVAAENIEPRSGCLRAD